MRLKENLLGTACNRMLGVGKSSRVAIVGSQASGKTVFLTSLIDHLRNHNVKALNLGQGVEILKCKIMKKSSAFPVFPYANNRSALVHDSTWPAKTAAVSEIKLELLIKQGKRNPELRRLEFLDFPGERSADFLMFSRSYSEWSDMVFEKIQADRTYSELAFAFHQVIESNAEEGELFSAYKMFLGNALSQRYSRIITPSCYLIDREGKRPEAGGLPESWARDRFCGLDESSQFVPLTQSARFKNKKLVNIFEQRYNRYRNEIVTPLVNWLANVDQMFILLDIPQILVGGSSMYNDEQAIAEQVMEICDRKQGLWHEIFQVGVLGWLFVKPTSVEKIGIVATKSDLVASNDDLDNLEGLARQMTYNKVRGVAVNDYRFFTCSTVVSTARVGCEPPRLNGHLVYDSYGYRVKRSESSLKEYCPSCVPELWPQDSNWCSFNFPEVYPKVSSRRDTPPPQEGLQRVVRFMLDL